MNPRPATDKLCGSASCSLPPKPVPASINVFSGAYLTGRGITKTCRRKAPGTACHRAGSLCRYCPALQCLKPDFRLLQKRTKISSSETRPFLLNCILDTERTKPHEDTIKATRRGFCLCLPSCRDFSLLKPSSPTQISQLPSKTKKKWGIRD